MEAEIKFKLPDEKEDLDIALKARTLHLVIFEMDLWLRNKIKYEDRTELQEVRDELWEIAEDVRHLF